MTRLGTALRLLAGSLLVTVLAVVAGWAAVTLLIPAGLSLLVVAVVSVVAEALAYLAGYVLLARRRPADEVYEVLAVMSLPVLVAVVTLFGTAGPLWFGIFAAVLIVGGSYLGLRLGSDRAPG